MPLAIDEFPVSLSLPPAPKATVLRGAEELRVKETDRIQAMAEGLKTFGVNCEPTLTV